MNLKTVFRNIQLLIGLGLMDTNLPENGLLVTKIKQQALGSGLFEAFLESAPQLILQSSIILRTGVTSKCYPMVLPNESFHSKCSLKTIANKINTNFVLHFYSTDT